MNRSGETCFSFQVPRWWHAAVLPSILTCTSTWGQHYLPTVCRRAHVTTGRRDSWQRFLVSRASHGWRAFLALLEKFMRKLWIGSVQRSQTFIFTVHTSVNILGEPAETLAVALPLEHTAHEHFHGAGVELLEGHVPLKEVNKKSLLVSPQQKSLERRSLPSSFPIPEKQT